MENLQPKPGILLDRFSGSGTSLFTARELEWKTTVIELLPVGIFATQARILFQKNQYRIIETSHYQIAKYQIWRLL